MTKLPYFLPFQHAIIKLLSNQHTTNQKITMENINPLQAISAEQTLTRNALEYKFTKSVPDIASIKSTTSNMH